MQVFSMQMSLFECHYELKEADGAAFSQHRSAAGVWKLTHKQSSHLILMIFLCKWKLSCSSNTCAALDAFSRSQ